MPIAANPVTVELDSIPEGLRFFGRINGLTVALDSVRAPAVPSGVNPVQLMMMALGGCTAMDVLSMLRKKRLDITAYEVLVGGERRDEHPRIFTRIDVLHRLRGHGIPRQAVVDAVELSHHKYCTISAQIGTTAEIVHRIEIVEETH
jgi:putative redox protein